MSKKTEEQNKKTSERLSNKNQKQKHAPKNAPQKNEKMFPKKQV